MATLARVFRVSKALGAQLSQNGSRTAVENLAFPKVGPSQLVRFISKSSGNKDNHTPVLDEPIHAPPSEILKQPIIPTKDWQTHGFDDEDPIEDLNQFHSSMFLSFSVVLVGIVMIWSYYPDPTEVDWTQREAFLQIRAKEAAGLPYVDPNYVDPTLVNLPSEEELDGIDLII